jgi:hypothetical protein
MWPSWRQGGDPLAQAARPKAVDAFVPKVEELVERTGGKIRADVTHRKLAAIGIRGSERSTRRAVAEVKAAWQPGRHGTGATLGVTGANDLPRLRTNMDCGRGRTRRWRTDLNGAGSPYGYLRTRRSGFESGCTEPGRTQIAIRA